MSNASHSGWEAHGGAFTETRIAMAHRFQFNQKDHEPIVMERMRVDMAGGLITVVDAQGQSNASFTEAELSSWYRIFPATTPY